MKYLGRKIYYDTTSGIVILTIGEQKGFIRETTVEEDIKTYKKLSERNRGTFNFLQLKYDEFKKDFDECIDYRVNIKTLELEFLYLSDGDGQDEPEAPIYQKPLIEELNDLNKKIEQQNQAIADLTNMIAMIQTP